MLNNILEQIAGNGPIAAVLVWFMWQHMQLVKQQISMTSELKDILLKNTAALTRVHGVLDKCEKR